MNSNRIERNLYAIILVFVFLTSCRQKNTRYDTFVPPDFKIHGIDVSRYQGKINWGKVAEQKKVEFAFIKASEGTGYPDPLFESNWNNIKTYKIKRGAYHFFRPYSSGSKQAKLYLSQVNFQDGDLLPVLDIELKPKRNLSAWYAELDAWLSTVEKETGKKPMIYASRKFYQDFLAERYKEHPVWIADYNRRKNPMSSKWHFWQHTENAKIDGINGKVDHNVFNGTIQDLQSLCF